MKLISLNLWGGRLSWPLFAFIKRYSTEADLFCFQEMNHKASVLLDSEEHPNLFEEFAGLLTDFKGYFSPHTPGVGIATFVRKNIRVENTNSFPILTTNDIGHLKMTDGLTYYPRDLQLVSLKGPAISVYNFHGLPGAQKTDTPERDLQTGRLQKILDADNNPKIVVGDFNLSPDTKAIRSLEKSMRNLIKESNFSTTRSRYYTKRDALPFADYCFISPDIRVSGFKVLQDEVSDHLPLFLEFN